MVPRETWRELLSELARRGGGTSEAGAFLLAARDGRVVSAIVYFDDLDPNALNGNVALSGAAFSRLAAACRSLERRVVADVHTHPGASVKQSQTDRRYPMVATRGHVAVIVPHLARRPVGRAELGFHRYDGEAGWTSFFGRAARRRLRLVR